MRSTRWSAAPLPCAMNPHYSFRGLGLEEGDSVALKLQDLLLPGEQMTRVKDAAAVLARRRVVGSAAGLVALISAVTQVAFTFKADYANKLGQAIYDLVHLRFDDLARMQLDAPVVWGWLALTLSLTVYFAARWTGVLLSESREPFRYTFAVQPFNMISNTPGERCKMAGDDRLNLLHHDLTERLHQRIQRLSLLDQAPQESPEEKQAPRVRGGSHVHITGHVALREEREDQWVLQVTPIVRIGGATASATAARPVRYPLRPLVHAAANAGEASKRKPETTLRADAYNQVVERVYSRIATEIYRQIDQDVRKKIQLFPTPRLRSLALAVEAEDFARSNTVDAYDRAIALYRDALRFFDVMKLEWISRLLLDGPLTWRYERRYLYDRARILTGYAKCLIYKRGISALAGREGNPVFELPGTLAKTIDELETLHHNFLLTPWSDNTSVLRAALDYPREAWWRVFCGRPLEREFEVQQRLLFDLHLVSALALHHVESPDAAEEELARAAAIAPERVQTDALFLVARGLLTAEPEPRLMLFKQAADIAPQFQLARWQLANELEDEFRRRDDLTLTRADALISEYNEVLRINYGNIAALGAQGHLLWLTKQPDASERLKEGLEVKAIERNIFTGELSYRLARLAAEAGEFQDCVRFYADALAGDPGVATLSRPKTSRAKGADYREIGPQMLARFRSYCSEVEREVEKRRQRLNGKMDVSEKMLGVVHGFVSNDYGNACLARFQQTGNHEHLSRAIAAYERATRANPDDPAPWYNLQNAYGWDRQWDRSEECYSRATSLAPTWTEVAVAGARESFSRQIGEISRAQQRLSRRKTRREALEKELSELQQRAGELEALQAQPKKPPHPPAGARELFRLDVEALNRADMEASKLAQELQRHPAKLLQAMHRIAEGPEASEDEVFEELEKGLGQPIDQAKRKQLKAEFFIPASTQDSRGPHQAWLADIQVDVQKELRELREHMSALEMDLKSAQKAVVAAEEEADKAHAGLPLHRDAAFRAVTRNSRLPALYEGDPEQWAERIIALPWRSVNEADVNAFLAIAHILINVPNEPKFLLAGIRLAEHIYRMTPGSHEVATTLLSGLTRLLNDESLSDELKTEYIPKKKDCDANIQRIVERWIREAPRMFLAIYWHLSLDDGNLERRVAELEARYKSQEAEFNNLLGHVRYHLFDSDGAIAAYRKAVKLDARDPRPHYHIGKILSQQHDWERARAAFEEAHRLDPTNEGYSAGLASTYAEVGNRHLRDRQFQDAAQHFTQAIALDAGGALYYSRLAAVLSEMTAGEPSAIDRAIAALEKACGIAPQNEEFRASLERLRGRKAALEVFGNASTANRPAEVTPITVEVSRDLDSLITEGRETLSAGVKEKIAAMRQDISRRWGVFIPGLLVRSVDLPRGTYVLALKEIPLTSGTVDIGKMLCLGPDNELDGMSLVDILKTKGIKAEPASDPIMEAEAAWIAKQDAPLLAETDNVKVLDTVDYILRHMTGLAGRNLLSFLGYQEVANIVRESESDRTRSIADDPVRLGLLTAVLRSLLAEEVPITSIDDLCEYFLINEAEQQLPEMVEGMRQTLKTALPGYSEAYKKAWVGPRLARKIEGSIVEAGDLKVLAIEPEACQAVLSAIRTQLPNAMKRALVVAEPNLRIHLRKLVELELPDVPVLSAEELALPAERAALAVVDLAP